MAELKEGMFDNEIIYCQDTVLHDERAETVISGKLLTGLFKGLSNRPWHREYFEGILTADVREYLVKHKVNVFLIDRATLDVLSEGVADRKHANTAGFYSIGGSILVALGGDVDSDLSTVKHELRHHFQASKGILKMHPKGLVWNGLLYRHRFLRDQQDLSNISKSIRLQITNLPWESEAYFYDGIDDLELNEDDLADVKLFYETYQFSLVYPF